MSNFTAHEFFNGQLTSIKTDDPLEDWDAVRNWFKTRGRSKTGQVVIIHNEKIYAVEVEMGTVLLWCTKTSKTAKMTNGIQRRLGRIDSNEISAQQTCVAVVLSLSVH